LADEELVEFAEPVDPVERWVRVIDQWVRQVDKGMGATADGVVPAPEPESPPEAS
jgi:hypothetical protein